MEVRPWPCLSRSETQLHKKERICQGVDSDNPHIYDHIIPRLQSEDFKRNAKGQLKMNALTGVRVIEVGQFYFAPYCAMMLARLGADVVKVEAPEGDPYRRLPSAKETGTSVQFTLLNSGKRFINLDLKSAEGREILLKLLNDADVLVQNLAPGAMERFGLDYGTLHAHNPKLIVASGSGFGSFGPYAGEPAMDLTIQARTAIMSTTGFEDGTPVRTGPSIVDFNAGAHLFGAVMAALYQRTVTGKGQHVEVSLQDAIIPSLSSNIAGFVNSDGKMPERTGNRNGGLAVTPYNAYPTNDGWITILCPTNGHWGRLTELIGDPRLEAAEFHDMAGRNANMDFVDELIGEWTAGCGKDEIFVLLKKANIPSAPVVTLPELLEDPHVKERGVIRKKTDEQGTWWSYGSPLFLSESPTLDPERAGVFGRDTEDILTNELGISEEEMTRYRAAGAI
jgi:crotonobetainyl-CoA:carnitine CoA-transferase CaiB-like acyl-CoA transferase